MTAVPAGFKVDPLIAEARRRQRRRRLVVAAAVVAAAAAGLGVWRLNRGSSSPSVRAERLAIAQAARKATIVEEGMTGGVGWAMNGLGLWLTADGGRTWLAATPKHVQNIGDAVARIEQIQFVDRGHGWLTAADVLGGFPIPKGAAGLRHEEIDRTTDGGRTWKASVPPGCLQSCGETYVSFLGTQRGYAIAVKGLFATNDGGATWTRVSRPPFTGAITFLDAKHAFGVSDPTKWVGAQYDVPVDGGVLYRTGDGGRHWSRVALPAPSMYVSWQRTADPVTFFGKSGVVPVRFRNPQTHVERLVVYVTVDGGATWMARPAPTGVTWLAETWGLPVTGEPYFSAATARDWVLAAKRELHVTTDGGRSWHTVRPRDLPSGGSISEVVFDSVEDGWAILGLPLSANTTGLVLVRTTDGGVDWTPLLPPVRKG